MSTRSCRGTTASWASRLGNIGTRRRGVAMTLLDPDLFMPEPLPREVKYTVISVDDHVVEPAHLFRHYLPAALRDRGPQIIETGNGAEVWQFEGQIYSQVGMNAIAGRRKDTVKLEPFRFEHM